MVNFEPTFSIHIVPCGIANYPSFPGCFVNYSGAGLTPLRGVLLPVDIVAVNSKDKCCKSLKTNYIADESNTVNVEEEPSI